MASNKVTRTPKCFTFQCQLDARPVEQYHINRELQPTIRSKCAREVTEVFTLDFQPGQNKEMEPTDTKL